MIRCTWLHPPRAPLTEAGAVGPVVEHLSAFPLATWARYALNGLPTFRPFGVERLHIDALTQRTQTLSLEDRDGRWHGLVTLGKYGERPGVLVQSSARTLEVDEAEALEGWLHAALDVLPLLDRVYGVNALALAEAALAPVPGLESPGAWDWVSERLIDRSRWPARQDAPGRVESLRDGLLLVLPEPRWELGSASHLARAAAWWSRPQGVF